MWCSCAGPRTGAQRAPSRCEVQSWESCHDVSETTPRSRSQVRACELQNRQWATPVDLGISSQIVICLLFACDYLRYIVLPDNGEWYIHDNKDDDYDADDDDDADDDVDKEYEDR